MSSVDTIKYLEKLRLLKPTERSKLNRNFSFEAWNVDLAIIKAERIRKRIIAIRRTIYIICFFQLVWYSLNVIALLYDMITERFKPWAHLLGLVYNLVGLSTIAIFHRSVRFKSMTLDTVYLILISLFLISILLINLVLLALFFGVSSQSDYLTEKVTKYDLNFDPLDLITSIILFVIYLILIVSLNLMRSAIFESKKYNKLIEKAFENRNEQEVNEKSDRSEESSLKDKNKANLPIESHPKSHINN